MKKQVRQVCCLLLSVLAGSLDASSAQAQVSEISFDEPRDGTTWHRGDVIRARIRPSAPISATGPHPALELIVGDNPRTVEGRIFQNGSRAQFFYPVRRDDAAAEVRMARVSLGGSEVDLRGFAPTTYAVDGSSAGDPPVLDGIGLSSFFVPAGGVYRPGDEIYWYARFHKAVTVSGAPVLAQRIGEETRDARYRHDIQTLVGSIYFTYTVRDEDCDMDGVGIPANAIRGGAVREADGSRAADTSHAAQDPADDLQAGATRLVACAVPASPAPGLVLLASFLLATGAHWLGQRRGVAGTAPCRPVGLLEESARGGRLGQPGGTGARQEKQVSRGFIVLKGRRADRGEESR